MNTITTHSPKFRIGAKESKQARRRQQSFIFKLIVLAVLLVGVLTFSLQAQILVSGATAANGTYTSLTKVGGAFAAINASAQTGNNILITVTANSTTEDGTNSLNANDWATLTIRPNGTREVSGTVDAPLLNLDGADNVTIDGRVSGVGTTKSLTIANYSAGTSATTIRYINSAENNTIKYSTLKGSGTSISNTAVVFYYTATAGNGNDNNIIDNCNLTNAGSRPFNLIFIQGTLGRENDNIVISNNNFYDFFSPSAAAASRAISFSGFTSDVSITGNSFYETTTLSLGSCNYVCIDNSLSTTAATTTVTGNYIGGSAPLCAGSAFTVNSSNLSKFSAISLQRGNSSIQNNTIKNISWTAENTGLLVFEGISVGGSGTHNIGTTQGNTIGASTGTGSITVTNTSSTSSSSNNLIAIQANTASGVLNIQNNTIGSLTAVGGSTVGFTIYGINKGSTANTNISSNLIGSLTTANSIQTIAASTAADQDVQGIRINSGGATVTGNTIANLTNLGTRTGAAVTGGMRGISANVSGGQVSITNNTVRDLTTSQAGSNATTSGASCVGIAQGSTTASVIQTVSNNTIYNLTNSNTGANAVKVYGIVFDANATGLHTVNTNIVYNVTVASSSATAEIGGIKAMTGNTMYYNNIVLIGNGQSNSTPLLYGILDAGTSSSINSFYFNTAYVYGATTSGSSLSAAFRSAASTSTIKNYRNNLFFNARSNSGTATGKHYAAHYVSVTNLTTNYNDYFVNGTGGTLGNVAATDQATLVAFKAATLQDANSLNLNPVFANAGGTSATDYLPTTTLTGVAGTGVTTDFLGSTRTTPMIGAVEFASILPVQLASWDGKTVADGNRLEWTTASEIHNAYFEIQKSANARDFEAIGRVQGQGTSSQTSYYQFTDTKASAELTYYRLKQVDTDGGVHYSPTLALRQSPTAAVSQQAISVYPNPAHTYFNLTQSHTLTEIRVYNHWGQCVYAHTKNAGELLPNIDIADWKAGVYRIAATNPDGQTQLASLLK